MTNGIEYRQEAILALLTWRIRLYTGLDHSSVRAEVAQAILDSTLYTLGLGEAALTAGLVPGEMPLEELFRLGRKRIDAKRKTARQLHLLVRRTMLPLSNATYRETLVGGISAFFRVYAPDFAAQEIHITCDYPLYVPVDGLLGISFIECYLERALKENQFCGYFPTDALGRLWARCGGGSEYALFNLFEPVFLAALGCVLTGADPLALSPSRALVGRLQTALLVKSRAEVEVLTMDACRSLGQALGIRENTVKRYLALAAPTAAAALFHGIENLTLGQTLRAV